MTALQHFKAQKLYESLTREPEVENLYGLVAPYDEHTGDGRMIRSGALSWDDDPIPLVWDRDEGDHTGMIVGKITELTDDGDGVTAADGELSTSDDPETQAAVSRVRELISEGNIGWSLGLDDIEAEETHSEPEVTEHENGDVTFHYSSTDSLSVVNNARVRHVALVDTPAFPAARPTFDKPINAAVAIASEYPASHFAKWDSDQATPLQVDKSGRVWGHAAGDGCYRGMNQCVTYTRDPDPEMRNFHTGTISLDDGSTIRAGALTAANLHANPNGPIESQRRHHEDTSTIWARVIAWNDKKGRLCVSGSVVPGLSEHFIGQVAGMPISVEMWPVPGVGGRTLVGAHTVVTPAWPV